MIFCYQALKVNKSPCSQKLQVELGIYRVLLWTDIKELRLKDLIQQKFNRQSNVYF